MNDIDDPKAADLVRKRSRGRPPLPKGLKCLKCGTTDTPEWRVGETGPHTLCNACGLQYAKKKKWEIESKAKHSLKNILNDEEEREINMSTAAMALSPRSPATPQQGMMIQQPQQAQSFHPSSSFQPPPSPYQASSFHNPSPSFQVQSQFQPPPFQQQSFQPSSFQPSSFQPPSSFQQYQPSTPSSQQNANANNGWVYSRDHNTKMRTHQEMQSQVQHSSAIDMPGGPPGPGSLSHSYINSYINTPTPSSNSSSSFSSINFSPFSLSSLSSASSGSESPYSPYSPHTHLR